MDNTDLKIIEILNKNSRTTASAIAQAIHLSVPAAAERIRRLEESGVIRQYTLKLDRKSFNLNLLAFILVTVEDAAQIAAFKEAALKSPAVLECHHIAGQYDYLLKVAVQDTGALEEFIFHTLKKLPAAVRTNTAIVLSSVKEEN